MPQADARSAALARDAESSVEGSSSEDEGSTQESLLRKEKDENTRKRHKKYIKRVVFIGGTASVGVAGLMYSQSLGFVEALYVVTQVVTTIGYGDITVDSDWERFFMALYALWMLWIVAYFLNNTINDVIQRQEGTVRGRLRDFERQVVQKYDPELELHDEDIKNMFGKYNKLVFALFMFFLHLIFGTFFFWLWEGCTCSYGALAKEYCDPENPCEKGYTMNIVEAFYMSVITLTTVGFGDYTPKTMSGQLIGIVWMLSGVFSTASFLGSMQGVIFGVDEQPKFSDSDLVSAKWFKKMDSNQDGTLTRGEFIAYCLYNQKLVDREILDSMSELYDRIDHNKSKTITFTDVMTFQSRHTEQLLKANTSLEKTCTVS